MAEFDENYLQAKKLIKIGPLEAEAFELVKHFSETNDENIVQIAFFGNPGSGKSTTINFLITGKLQGILPNSSQKGEGCTKFPIRCVFNESDKIKLYLIKTGQKEKEFKIDFDSFQMEETRKYIDRLNNDKNIEEIILQIPVKIFR